MERTPTAAELRKEFTALVSEVPRWVATLLPPWGPIPHGHREDVVQEALARATEALARYTPREDGSMKAWLYQITRRTARELRLREAWKAGFAADVDTALVASRGETAEQSVVVAQLVRMLHETIAELSEELRDIVVARELAGLSMKEVAEVVGLPERTVKARAERGRAMVVERMLRKVGDRNMGVLPVPIDGIFVFVRGQLEGDAESGEARGGVWAPPIEAPVADALLWKQIGTFVGGFGLGGAVVGGMVYWWLSHASSPELLRAHIREPRMAIAQDAAPVEVAPTTAPRGAPSAGFDPDDDARTIARVLLDRAMVALSRKDLAGARAALAEHDARFTRAPMAEHRAIVVRQIEAFEEKRGVP